MGRVIDQSLIYRNEYRTSQNRVTAAGLDRWPSSDLGTQGPIASSSGYCNAIMEGCMRQLTPKAPAFIRIPTYDVYGFPKIPIRCQSADGQVGLRS